MTAAPAPDGDFEVRPPVALGAVLLLAYAVVASWSIGVGYGGYTADGGWVDWDGAPTAVAPMQVDVQSGAAWWGCALILGALLVGWLTARRAPTAESAARRLLIGCLAAVGLVALQALIGTALQMQLVQAAVDAHRVPVVFGSAVVHVSRMPPG